MSGSAALREDTGWQRSGAAASQQTVGDSAAAGETTLALQQDGSKLLGQDNQQQSTGSAVLQSQQPFLAGMAAQLVIKRSALLPQREQGQGLCAGSLT